MFKILLAIILFINTSYAQKYIYGTDIKNSSNNAVVLKVPSAIPTAGVMEIDGAGNITGKPEINLPISTATQAALDLKANLSLFNLNNATQIYIDSVGGDDTNGTGSATRPFLTIEKALTLTTNPAVQYIVEFAPGGYGSIPITIPGNVNLHGEGHSDIGVAVTYDFTIANEFNTNIDGVNIADLTMDLSFPAVAIVVLRNGGFGLKRLDNTGGAHFVKVFDATLSGAEIRGSLIGSNILFIGASNDVKTGGAFICTGCLLGTNINVYGTGSVIVNASIFAGTINGFDVGPDTPVVRIDASSSFFGGTISGATLSFLDAASKIAYTPTGGISSSTVQAAINEIDTEKAPIDSPTFTNTTTADVFNTNSFATNDALITYLGGVFNVPETRFNGSVKLITQDSLFAETYISFSPPNTVETSVAYVLPAVAGNADDCWKTDGSSIPTTLRWESCGILKLLTLDSGNDETQAFIGDNELNISTFDGGGYISNKSQETSSNNWVAKATDVVSMGMKEGVITFYANGGLIVDDPFSPTIRMIINNVGVGVNGDFAVAGGNLLFQVSSSSSGVTINDTAGVAFANSNDRTLKDSSGNLSASIQDRRLVDSGSTVAFDWGVSGILQAKNDLQIQKDLVFKGNQPTCTPDANAGTGATCSIISDSSDSVGTIRLDSGTLTIAAGALVDITFDTPFAGGGVFCTLTSINGNASALAIYVSANTTDLLINTGAIILPSSTYQWNYHCLNSQN